MEHAAALFQCGASWTLKLGRLILNKHRDVADRGLAQIDEPRHRTVTSRDGQQGSDTSSIEQRREKRG